MKNLILVAVMLVGVFSLQAQTYTSNYMEIGGSENYDDPFVGMQKVIVEHYGVYNISFINNTISFTDNSNWILHLNVISKKGYSDEGIYVNEYLCENDGDKYLVHHYSDDEGIYLDMLDRDEEGFYMWYYFEVNRSVIINQL